MRTWLKKSVWILALLLFLPAMLLAAESAADSTVIVADSRKFSGLQAWWANLYNESHIWFAVITIAILPTAALLLGQLTSALMARLGINLKSRELAEH